MPVVIANRRTGISSNYMATGATSFIVDDGSAFPVLGDSEWMYMTIDSEVVKVTATVGDTFTCEATSSSHQAGRSITMLQCAEAMYDLGVGSETDLANMKKFANI